MTKIKYIFKILCLLFIGFYLSSQALHAQITDTISAKAQNQKAKDLMTEGKLSDAAILFTETADFYKKKSMWEKYFGTHIDLSTCYLELGQFEEGIRSSDTLIHQSKLNLTNPERFEINGFLNLGNINFKLSNLEEAGAAFTSALEISQKTYGEEHLLTADSYGGLATLNEQLGDDQKSLDYNLKALSIREKLLDKNHADLGYSYMNIGIIYKNRGELKKALAYYKKTEAIFESALGAMHPKMGIVKNNIGRVYAAQDKLDIAIEYYNEVVEIFTVALSPDHPNIGLIKTNIAMIYLGEFKYEKAAVYLNEAYDVWIKSLPADHYYFGVYHNNIAMIYAMQSNFEAALKNMETAIHIYKNRVGENSPELAMIHNNIAIFLTKLKRYDRAIAVSDTALAINTIQSNNGNLSFKDPSFNPLEHLRSQSIQAKVYGDQFQNTKNLKYAQEAFATLAKSEEFINERNKIYISEDDQIQDNSSFYANLKQATSLHAEVFQQFNDPKNLKEAFRFSEKVKSTKLLQATNVVDPVLYARVPANIIEEERQTRTNITNYEAEVLNFALTNDSLNMVEYRDRKLFHEKLKLDTLIKVIRTEYPNYYDMKYATDVATLNDLQSAIPDETLIISYLIDPQQHDQYAENRIPKLHIFTISKSTVNIKTVDWTTRDDTLANDFLKIIQKSSIVKTKNKKNFIDLGHQLYQKLIGTISSELNGNKRLIIIGEGYMNYLPFEALVQNNKYQSFQNLDYLIKDFEISYHYSATLYLKSLQKKQELNNLNLLAFAPVFDNPTRSTIPADQQRHFQDSSYSFLRDNRYQPLLWSEKEVLAIYDIFQGQSKNQNKLLLRNDASEGSLKKYINQHQGIVHIASHSFANMISPKFSGIACSINSNESKEDGILHINEIYNIQTNADLVVLSSCESGLGYYTEGEGMLGINRSFLYSGANNVLYSLWKVDDKASSELMVEFYKQIFNDKNYAAALRASKLKLLTNETTALPNYWAPFVLISR